MDSHATPSLPGLIRIVVPVLLASALLASPAPRAAAAPALPASVPSALLVERMAAGDATVVVLDVRTVGEYRSGHIPGAINIPVRELAGRLDELGAYRDRPLVVHCEMGPRADYAAGVLREAGFVDIHELEGHMHAWRTGGYPVQ